MDFNDVLTLAKAGFSREQILKMSTLQATQQAVRTPAVLNPQAVAQPATVAQQAQTTVAQPATVAQQAQTTVAQQAQGIQSFDDLYKKLADDMNLSNILNATNAVQPETSQDILASIINPKQDGGNK